MKVDLHIPLFACLSVLLWQSEVAAQTFRGFSDFKNQIVQCNPGPWGDLEYHFTYLEAPKAVMDLTQVPSGRAIWYFPDWDKADVQTFLAKCGMSEELQQKVIKSVPPLGAGSVLRFFPTPEVLTSITPETRSKIYRELRKWPENGFYHNPVIIESGNVQEWFSKSNLSDKNIERIEALTYLIGDTLAFSDVHLLIAQVAEDKEERALMKALTRTRSLVLRIKVNPESDIPALREYWRGNFQNGEMPPLLKSLARGPGGHNLDIIHLLPPTPKKYLNRFPSLSLGVDGVFPDSLWTATNFFNYTPRSEYGEPAKALAFLHSAYEKIETLERCGDVILVLHPETGEPLHAATFVADDIAYTKNGRSIKAPFILKKISDILARFQGDTPPKIEYWRKKGK